MRLSGVNRKIQPFILVENFTSRQTKQQIKNEELALAQQQEDVKVFGMLFGIVLRWQKTGRANEKRVT